MSGYMLKVTFPDGVTRHVGNRPNFADANRWALEFLRPARAVGELSYEGEITWHGSIHTVRVDLVPFPYV